MSDIFLSYARADGADAAKRLHGRLERVGHTVCQDVDNLRAGKSWQLQLGQALRTTDVVLVLLTPGAVESKYVEWEWTSALFVLEKPVISVLIAACEIPGELARLQYRDLSDPAKKDDEYDALLGDLSAIQQASKLAASSSTKYRIEGGQNNVIGNGALGIYGLSAQEINKLKPDKLRRLQNLAYAIDEEQHNVKYDIRSVDDSVMGDRVIGVFGRHESDGAALVLEIRGLFEVSESRIITQLIARIELQEVRVLAEVRDITLSIDKQRVPEQDIQSILTEIQDALSSILAQKTIYDDIVLTGEVQSVANEISDPGLDVRHRLKVCVPIIPVLLAYEGEIEFNIRANLEAIWQRLTNWSG